MLETVASAQVLSSSSVHYRFTATFDDTYNVTTLTNDIQQNFKRKIADGVNANCGAQCTVSEHNITFVASAQTSALTYDLEWKISMKNTAASVYATTPDSVLPSAIFQDFTTGIATTTSTAFVAITDQVTEIVETSAARPDACGDGVIGGGEQCDDQNRVSGDGCSTDCVFEPGYMCKHGVRSDGQEGVQGRVLLTSVVNGSTAYSISNNSETCQGPDICKMGGLWTPESYQHLYPANFVLPPRGFYCSDVCKLFPVPNAGLEISSSCALVDVNECAKGLAVCDFRALCSDETFNETTGKGYSCRCEENYFASKADGLGCVDSGFEVVFGVAGQEGYAGDPTSDLANMEPVRAAFIAAILTRGFLKPTADAQILSEQNIDYPPTFVRILTDTDYAGRALYQVKVRIASVLVDPAAMVSDDIFSSLSSLQPIFTDTASPPAFKLYTEKRCSDERDRTCEYNADCIQGGVCLHAVPSVSMASLNAGGSNAPLYSESSGMEIVSTTYSNTETAWLVRLRYKPTPDAMSVLYVSHVQRPLTGEMTATFLADEFICGPLGTGDFQQRRDDTVCCLPAFRDLYTTTQGFVDYLNDTSKPLAREIVDQDKCKSRADAPANSSLELLDAALPDFVSGAFARMTRSTATLDPNTQGGYRDINLYLASEDMRALGGIENSIDGGFSIRFFVGMAHIKPLSTPQLSVSHSQLDIRSDITNTFFFQTSAQTDFTFLKDVNVNLLQIKNQTMADSGAAGDPYLKFARVQLTVPETVTADDLTGILPYNGLMARVGYTKDTAVGVPLSGFDAAAMYPCLNVYTGSMRADIDTLIAGQDYCTFKDPICATIGPVAVNDGGQVSFIVPLLGDYWERDTASSGLLSKRLYLDFVLSVRDASGKRVLTNVETSTEIATLAINSLCEEKQLLSAIDDIMTIDLFLGLTPNASAFNDSLVQALDITRAEGDVHLSRDISSKSANVLTMLLKGSEDTFSNDYAKDYSLQVEDMITVHFLDLDKKAQVEQLIADSRAVYQTGTESENSEMRLFATDELLSICPMHSTRNVLGCLTRKEIHERNLDIVTRAVTLISPQKPDDLPSVIANAGLWTQSVLGESEFANNLGKQHARVFNDIYNLNHRYKKGYMISPTIPWTQTEMASEGFTSSIDLAQTSISFFLVSFSQNLDRSWDPVAQVAIPSEMPVSVNQFREDFALQNAIASAYAQGLGKTDDEVSIDQDSIRAVGTDSRRRLLQTESTSFEVVVTFSDKETAQEEAAEMVDVITAENSQAAQAIFEQVVIAVSTACPECPPPEEDKIKPPAALREVMKASVREVGSCVDPSINVDLLTEIGAPGRATCTGRFANDGSSLPIAVRGPLTDAEWELVGPYWSDTASYSAGWQQVDFCGDVPWTWGSGAADKWASLKAKFADCCLCQGKTPNSKDPYVHRYSWGVPVSQLNEHALFDGKTWNEIDWDTYGVSLMNPQVGTFRSAGADPLISTEGLPPAEWRFTELDNGKRVFDHRPVCGSGYGVQAFADGCEICPLGSFSGRVGVSCIKCSSKSPEWQHKTTAQIGLSSATADNILNGGTWPCSCAPGYYGTAASCLPCPANTYKESVSDDADECLPCPSGLESRPGSPSAGSCIAAVSAGGYVSETHVFKPVLGLVSHTSRVIAGLVSVPADEQDNSRLCRLDDAATGLQCPGSTLPGVFPRAVAASALDNVLAPTEFYATDNIPGLLFFHDAGAVPQESKRLVLHSFPAPWREYMYNGYDRDDLKGLVQRVSLPVKKGYDGPAPPGFHEQILAGVDTWRVGTKISLKLRVHVPSHDLSAESLRVGVFVASKELNTAPDSTDWQWIFCGKTDGSYAPCRTEPDPDAPASANLQSPHIVASTMFTLSSTKTCFADNIWWLDDCADSVHSPGNDVYDSVYDWVPLLNYAQSDMPLGPFYLYMVMYHGESPACVDFGCNEAVFYSQMAAHVAEPFSAAAMASVDFLPGSAVTVETRPDGEHTAAPAFATALGLVSSPAYEHEIPPAGMHTLELTSLHSRPLPPDCVLGEATSDALDCTGSGGAEHSALFSASIAADGETVVGRFTAPKVTPTTYTMCCTDPLNSACALDEVQCFDTLHADTSGTLQGQQHTYSKPFSFTAHDEDLYDLLHACGQGGDEACTCASSPVQPDAAGAHPHYTQIASVSYPGEISYAGDVAGESVASIAFASAALLTNFVVAGFGSIPTVQCTKPTITQAPCLDGDSVVLPVYTKYWRTVFQSQCAISFKYLYYEGAEFISVSGTDITRMDASFAIKPVWQANQEHATTTDADPAFDFVHDNTGALNPCPTSDNRIHSESAPFLVFYASPVYAVQPPCACNVLGSLPLQLVDWHGAQDSPPSPEPTSVVQPRDVTACAWGTCTSCATKGSGLALQPVFEHLDFQETDTTTLTNLGALSSATVALNGGMTLVTRFEVNTVSSTARQQIMADRTGSTKRLDMQIEKPLAAAGSKFYFSFYLRGSGYTCGAFVYEAFDGVFSSTPAFITAVVTLDERVGSSADTHIRLYDSQNTVFWENTSPCNQDKADETYDGIVLAKSPYTPSDYHYYDAISHVQIYDSAVSTADEAALVQQLSGGSAPATCSFLTFDSGGSAVTVAGAMLAFQGPGAGTPVKISVSVSSTGADGSFAKVGAFDTGTASRVQPYSALDATRVLAFERAQPLLHAVLPLQYHCSVASCAETCAPGCHHPSFVLNNTVAALSLLQPAEYPRWQPHLGLQNPAAGEQALVLDYDEPMSVRGFHWAAMGGADDLPTVMQVAYSDDGTTFTALPDVALTTNPAAVDIHDMLQTYTLPSPHHSARYWRFSMYGAAQPVQALLLQPCLSENCMEDSGARYWQLDFSGSANDLGLLHAALCQSENCTAAADSQASGVCVRENTGLVAPAGAQSAFCFGEDTGTHGCSQLLVPSPTLNPVEAAAVAESATYDGSTLTQAAVSIQKIDGAFVRVSAPDAGVVLNQNYMHLQTAASMYVRFDLGASKSVAKVKLFPHQDGDASALRNYQIWIGDDASFAKASLQPCAQYDAANDVPGKLQYEPGAEVSKACHGQGRYVYIEFDASLGEQPSLDAVVVVPAPWQFTSDAAWTWSANMVDPEYLPLGDGPSTGPADQPYAAVFAGADAWVQMNLPDVQGVKGLQFHTGSLEYTGGNEHAVRAWPGHVQVYVSDLDDFDSTASTSVLVHSGAVDWQGSATQAVVTLDTVRAGRHVRIHVQRATDDSAVSDHNYGLLVFRVGLLNCMFRCAGCCGPTATIRPAQFPGLDFSGLAAGSVAAVTVQKYYAPAEYCKCAQTICPCSRNQCDTSSYTLSVVAGAYKLGNVDTPTLQITRGEPLTIHWPATHPLAVSAEHRWQGAPVPSLVVSASAGTTTLTLPADYPGHLLYYYCQAHEPMPIGVLEVLDPGAAPVESACATAMVLDRSAWHTQLAFERINATRVVDSAFDAATEQYLVTTPQLPGHTPGRSHIFDADPASSAAWAPVYADEDAALATGKFTHWLSSYAPILHQFEPLYTAKIAARHGQPQGVSLPTRRGYQGPGAPGFVQKYTTWHRDSLVEFEPNVFINARFPADSPRAWEPSPQDRYYDWEDGTKVHAVLALTTKELDLSPMSTDWNWLVCGELSEHALDFPPPMVTLDASEMSGHVPSNPYDQGQYEHAGKSSYKSASMFQKQGGFLPAAAGFADADCTPLSDGAANPACNTEYSAAMTAGGWARCDLALDLKAQGTCAYTLGDVKRKFFFDSPNRYDGNADKLLTPAADLTRNLLARAPEVHLGDSGAVLLSRGRLSLCHQDLYAANIDYTHNIEPTARRGLFLPQQPLDNNMIPAGAESGGNLEQHCSVPLPDGADEATYLQTTPLLDVLNLFQNDLCMCGLVFTAHDAAPAAFRVVAADRADPANEHVFVSRLTDADSAAGNPLGRAFMPEQTKTLFKTDPATTLPSSVSKGLPAQYSICADGTDADTGKAQQKNPHVLDGVVVPLSRTPKASLVHGDGLYEHKVELQRDGCSFMKPHLRVLQAFGDGAKLDSAWSDEDWAQASLQDIGVVRNEDFADLYGDMTGTKQTVQDAHFTVSSFATDLPLCKDAVNATDCTSEYCRIAEFPCRFHYDMHSAHLTRGCLLYSSDANYAALSQKVMGFGFVDRVFVDGSGWADVCFEQSTSGEYWYVRENLGVYSKPVDSAASHTDANGLWPVSDPLHFAADTLVVGGSRGVGLDVERCPTSSTDYRRQYGVVSWTPQLAQTPTEPVFLYQFYLVGESTACAQHGCDEHQVYDAMADHLDADPFPDGRHPLTVMRGSRVTVKTPVQAQSGGGARRLFGAPAQTGRRQRSLLHLYQKKRGLARRAAPRASLRPVRQRLPVTRRKLLSVGDSAPKTSKGANVQREITSVDADATLAMRSCGRAGVCQLVSLTFDVPRRDYCLPEDDLIDSINEQLKKLALGLGTTANMTALSVYRHDIFSTCFGSYSYPRRLLSELRAVSVRAALSVSEPYDCEKAEDCYYRLDMSDTKLNELGFSHFRTFPASDGGVAVRVCYKDANDDCGSYVELSNVSTIPRPQDGPAEKTSSSLSTEAVLLIVVLSLVGVYLLVMGGYYLMQPQSGREMQHFHQVEHSYVPARVNDYMECEAPKHDMFYWAGHPSSGRDGDVGY